MRDERLRECVDVIRRLLAGEEVNHDGLVTVNRGRLWTLPETVPPLVGPAVTPATAARHAEWADALITVNQPLDVLEKVLAAYRDAGGRGPARLQIHLSWAPTQDEALSIAHDQWRSNVHGPPVAWDTETVEAFDLMAEHVTPEHVAEVVRVSERPRSARGVAAGVRRPGVGRALPALRRQGAGPLHRRLRRERPAAARPHGATARDDGDPGRPARGGALVKFSQTGDLWWKNAVLYCADVQTFADSDGDGQGDLRGMTERIEYLADLGVTCLWLMPFYPTANKDDGYDITDFFGVDPRLGSHGDFVELVRTARSAGLRVIVDFVMNHTSDQHPWFKSARRSTDDRYRDYYVWAPTEPRSSAKDVVFPDQEDSIWELDERTGEWFLHHFYKTQPDLNVANPAVQEEIAKTLGFWLQLGVSGFRVDAVPFLFARDAVPGSRGRRGVQPRPLPRRRALLRHPPAR